MKKAKAQYTHVMWIEEKGTDAERFSRSAAGASKYVKLYERVGYKTQVMPITECPTGPVVESRNFHPYDQLTCPRIVRRS
jgi:hypothetical protein